MGAMASQINSLGIVYSIVHSGADQRKHPSSASLAFVRGIHRWPVNSPHKKASNAENVSIWWRHHGNCWTVCITVLYMTAIYREYAVFCLDKLLSGRTARQAWKLRFTISHWETKYTLNCRRHFEMHFLISKYCIFIPISLKFVPKELIDNKSALVQVMAWRRTGDRAVSESIVAYFTDAYICVTRPQWTGSPNRGRILSKGVIPHGKLSCVLLILLILLLFSRCCVWV